MSFFLWLYLQRLFSTFSMRQWSERKKERKKERKMKDEPPCSCAFLSLFLFRLASSISAFIIDFFVLLCCETDKGGSNEGQTNILDTHTVLLVHIRHPPLVAFPWWRFLLLFLLIINGWFGDLLLLFFWVFSFRPARWLSWALLGCWLVDDGGWRSCYKERVRLPSSQVNWEWKWWGNHGVKTIRWVVHAYLSHHGEGEVH
jgi:hypothetical protein